jgi:predicted nuclease of predicted toxin-antitoxin system
MKLLFDQNLSFKLCQRLSDLFPDSSQVRLLGLAEAQDRTIWDHARTHGYILVTQDADFSELGALMNAPPKVIWLRLGNQPTEKIEKALRDHVALIVAFADDDTATCLEIY